MTWIRLPALLLGLFALAFGNARPVQAEQVKLEGVHLCCRACVVGVTKALTDVKGVSDIKASQDDETVTFEAADKDGIQAGLKALYAAGFYGTSSHPGPDLTIDKTLQKNEVEISGVHLCCPGCVNSARVALKDVSGVKGVFAKSREGKITLNGENINLAETLKALHAAGFHGTVK